jgi:hypothetical protein
VSGKFADQYGTELEVSGETALPGCARVWVSERCGIHVKAAGFPALIAALYEAAGLPAPIILARPVGGEYLMRHFPSALGAGITVNRKDGFVVIRGDGLLFDPKTVRDLAAFAVTLADEAESEPDPAEVEELAAAIRTGLHPDSGRPGEPDRMAARAALRWFRDKRQQGGGA